MISKVYIYFLLGAFIATSTMRVVTTKLSDLIQVTHEDGYQHQFRHPVFQTMVGFIGELMIACFWAIQFMLRKGKPISVS